MTRNPKPSRKPAPDAAPRFIECGPDGRVPLEGQGGLEAHDHVFHGPDVEAVNAALAAGRPLLVRGDPGVGKSQLARAAAAALRRAYVQFVVDSQTESRDLLWRFDAVARLAEAQLVGAVRAYAESEADRQAREAAVRSDLDIGRFIRPGPLWWAFDWDGAQIQADRCRSEPPPGNDEGLWVNGCVLLIDEIDKAEAEVPNGLLEALGSGEFTPGGDLPTVKAGNRRPLVIITSNDERALPAAFLRRCLILRMDLPDMPADLRRRLIDVGRAHFPDSKESVRGIAADMLIADREGSVPGARPGQAEYLDLLRAVLTRYPDDEAAQTQALDTVRQFTLRKHDRN